MIWDFYLTSVNPSKIAERHTHDRQPIEEQSQPHSRLVGIRIEELVVHGHSGEKSTSPQGIEVKDGLDECNSIMDTRREVSESETRSDDTNDSNLEKVSVLLYVWHVLNWRATFQAIIPHSRRFIPIPT